MHLIAIGCLKWLINGFWCNYCFALRALSTVQLAEAIKTATLWNLSVNEFQLLTLASSFELSFDWGCEAATFLDRRIEWLIAPKGIWPFCQMALTFDLIKSLFSLFHVGIENHSSSKVPQEHYRKCQNVDSAPTRSGAGKKVRRQLCVKKQAVRSL